VIELQEVTYHYLVCSAALLLVIAGILCTMHLVLARRYRRLRKIMQEEQLYLNTYVYEATSIEGKLRADKLRRRLSDSFHRMKYP